MENHIKNIELINAFLNKLLSQNEIKGFENKLNTDVAFKEEYETQVIFLEGLKRQSLKTEIIKAKHYYVRNKWFKYLGFTSLLLLVLGFVYLNLSIPIHRENIELPKETKHSQIVLDSVISEEPSKVKKVKKDTLKIKKEKVIVKQVIHDVISNKEITEEKIPNKPSEIFTINSQKDTTLICKEGTKLVVKANSFVDANNNLIEGNVDIAITEYYKLSDMLLANLTTTCNSKQLETGGMLFIEAKKGRNDLELKENSNIEIAFSTQNKKEGMQLFSGERKDEIINWQLLKPQDTIVKKKTETEDSVVPFSLVEEPPLFPDCENIDKSQQKKCTSQGINDFVQKNFNRQVAEDLGLKGRQRISVIFRINQDGDVVDIESRASDPELEKEAERVMKLLPKMKPGKQRGKVVTVPYSLPLVFQLGGVVTELNNKIRDTEYIKKLENKLKGKDSTKVTVVEMNSYVLRASKLQWINCDRFIKSKEFIKYKIKMKNSRGLIRVTMVFKSINSVMPSWRFGETFDFKEVPNGEDVVLIAIKKHNGKLYFDIVETKIEANPNLEFDFQEVNLEEMKSELKKLDILF